MKLVRNAAPGVSAADHYLALRDNPALAKPLNPSEAVATDKLHEFDAPSKAHIKRLLRPRPPITFTKPKPRYERPSYEWNDFHKRQIRALGGSMTILGEHEVMPTPRQPGVATTLEQYETDLATRDAAALEARRRRWRVFATKQNEFEF